MKTNITSIDLAKDSFQVCIFNPKTRQVVVNRAIPRHKLFAFLMNRHDLGLVVMEACSAAHYWARRVEAELNLPAFLISPQHVKPYRKGVKNDKNDALAIIDAYFSSKVRFVSIKTDEQLDHQALLREKELIDRSRTALSNQIRGLLAEKGIFIKPSVNALRQALPQLLEDHDSGLSTMFLALLRRLQERLMSLDHDVAEADKRLREIARSNEPCKRLMKIRGYGPQSALTIWAALGDGSMFKNGRDASANYGLVPKQFSTGGKPILGRITKRGDPAIRRVLVLGAYAVINTLGSKQDEFSCWLRALVERAGRKRAAVALANKNMRIGWAILNQWAHETDPQATTIRAAI